MHRAQEQVRDFHRACGLPSPEVFRIADRMTDDLALRLELVREESKELWDAAHAGDTEEQIDALCDILYVTYGYAVSQGWDLEEFFEEVHMTNMKKASGPKREDGKQLKPEGWKGPRIGYLIRKQRADRGPNDHS